MTEQEMIVLTCFEGERLRVGMHGVYVENVQGVAELAADLTPALQSAEPDGEITLSVKHLETAKTLTLRALRAELGHIDGLCESGQIISANERLDSQYGPKGFISLLTKILAVKQAQTGAPEEDLTD